MRMLLALLLASISTPCLAQMYEVGSQIKMKAVISCKDSASMVELLDAFNLADQNERTKFRLAHESWEQCTQSDLTAVVDKRLPTQIILRPDLFVVLELYRVLVVKGNRTTRRYVLILPPVRPS